MHDREDRNGVTVYLFRPTNEPRPVGARTATRARRHRPQSI
jgi:hypothetical protein